MVCQQMSLQRIHTTTIGLDSCINKFTQYANLKFWLISIPRAVHENKTSVMKNDDHTIWIQLHYINMVTSLWDILLILCTWFSLYAVIIKICPDCTIPIKHSWPKHVYVADTLRRCMLSIISMSSTSHTDSITLSNNNSLYTYMPWGD